MENHNFLDELLEEVEEKEQESSLPHADLVLKEISSLQQQIENNFTQAEEEQQIIREWSLRQNSKLQSKAEFLEKKLEAFMNEQGEDVKTIRLCFGVLRLRKQQDKIQITDMEEFMRNDNLGQLGAAQPEQWKPSITKIKEFIKMSTKIPKGVEIFPGEVKFSIKLKHNGGVNETET